MGDQVFDHIMPHVSNGRGNFFGAHGVLALLKDHLTLIVHDIVIFQQLLAHVEVSRFNFLLGLLERLVNPTMDNRLTLFEAETLQHTVHAFRAENPHQIVFERQEKFGGARVALTSGTATKLVIDASAFVTLGTDDIKPASLQNLFLRPFDLGPESLDLCRVRIVTQFQRNPHIGIATKLNVGTAARHIGRNRYRSGLTSLGDNCGLLLVEASIQDLMINPALIHQA